MACKIDILDGKYTFIKADDDYIIHVNRYGEPWIQIEKGHRAVSALMDDFIDMAIELERLKELSK